MAKNQTIASRTDLTADAVEEISSNLRRLLADVFALYVKTKNFHWHISGGTFAIITCSSMSRPRKSWR
jgi:starvation-inducible DNA-binding protein